jgi:Bacterial protein of unknown function (DUF899)
MNTPPVVSAEEWEAARRQLLVKEKELTRARDALAAAGYPQTPPYEWWHWHDDYGDTQREEFLEQVRRAESGDAG